MIFYECLILFFLNGYEIILNYKVLLVHEESLNSRGTGEIT